MNDLPLSRTLCVYKILDRYSDEAHPLTLRQIIELLHEQYQLHAHRTTVTKDIAELTAYGVDIVTVHSTQNRYFIGNRVFEIPELRLLIDAIHSSKCLTSKKSRELIDKLTTLASVHQADVLKARPLSDCIYKPKNEQIYYIMDTIHQAIDEGRQIEFQYFDYAPDKTVVLRNDGEVYRLSPYACLWSGDHYYAIGWSEKHQNVSAFRVDRVAGVPTLGEKAIQPPDGFDLQEYTKTVFEMYGGPLVNVELRCQSDMMKVILDRFTDDVEVTQSDDNGFTVTVKVPLSPTFYGWLFTFGGQIRLQSPSFAVNIYKEMLQKNLEIQ